ncbi:tRNA dimethylallyltransferase [Frankliniella fusca]|uniref:tRNA dimethylallyltransferase n=1 Tax=Frankliniella fusca TaxID=407009 RepID=A0AAE1LGA6_9NEOP|nr:tRNA dimethylallyltransferase [Frankliniella fusca]
MAPLIEIEHLVDALKGFSRPLREGRLAVANIVDPVGVRPSKSKRYVDVEAMVIRTTKINEPSVLVKIQIDKEATKVEDKIKSLSCQCPSGACKEHSCKHAMAVLIYLERNDESELETLTCTDVQQIWGSISEKTLSRFAPVEMHEFCCMKKLPPVYKREIQDVTPELEEEFRSLFIEEQSLALYNECSQEEKLFYDNRLKVTQEEAERMCADSLGQDNDLWKMFKYGRVTGSIIYSMFTYSKNKNAKWDSKFNEMFHSTFKGNDATDKGLMYEDDARDCYTKMYSKPVAIAGIIVNPLVPWLGFSPDGIIMDNDKPFRVWENKTPVKGQNVDGTNIGSCYSSMTKDGKLKEKHKHYGQVQLGMLITGLNACDYSLYCYGFENDSDLNKRMYVHTVLIDERFLIDMLERVSDVYFKKLLPWLVAHDSDVGKE